jgi:hypothetical protein
LLIDFGYAMFLTENYVGRHVIAQYVFDSIVISMFLILSIGYCTLYGSRTPVQS